jgi:hypothetical protein
VQMQNEHVILTHLSRRTDLKMAREMVNAALGEEKSQRVHFLMERPARRG